MAIRTLLGMSRSVALAAVLAFSAVSVVTFVAPPVACAQDVDVGIFYSGLAPHGEWFFQADLGWVWHPARVNVGWRPYTAGRWVWSQEFGWTWVSSEPWGWATYHYGRWYFDPIFGWSWVPGHTWAPAWVSWRIEAGFIGWAPLLPIWFDRHPDYRWDYWEHDHDWERRHHDRDWDRWVFTRDRDFTATNIASVSIRDRAERQRILRSTREVSVDASRPESIGRALDRARVEKAVGKPVPTVSVEEADKPVDRAEVSGDKVRMYRPRVKDAPDKTPDKLGVAKAPTPETREKNNLREEKQRLERAGRKTNVKPVDAAAPAAEPAGGKAPEERGGRPQKTDEAQPERGQQQKQDRAQQERQQQERAEKVQQERGQQQREEKAQQERQQQQREEKAQQERQQQQREEKVQQERQQQQREEKVQQQRQQQQREEKAQQERQQQQREQKAQQERQQQQREQKAQPKQPPASPEFEPQRAPSPQVQPDRAPGGPNGGGERQGTGGPPPQQKKKAAPDGDGGGGKKPPQEKGPGGPPQ